MAVGDFFHFKKSTRKELVDRFPNICGAQGFDRTLLKLRILDPEDLTENEVAGIPKEEF